MKEGRDVKFVIYQVLYIFVVCVIALKGADINLEEVLSKETAVPKEVADAVRRQLDSLLALGLVPKLDSTSNKIYSQEEVNQMLAGLVPKSEIEPETQLRIRETKVETPELKTEFTPPKTDKLATVQGVEFTQYTRPKITNPYNEKLEIYGDGKLVTSIPPKGSAIIAVNGESSFTFKVGESKDTKPTKEKQAPKIDIQKFISDGEDASLHSIQGRVAYRVTVVSTYPGDLNVNISGPVSTKQVSSTQFDITLNFLGSEVAFDNWSKGKQEPYKTNFTVTVRDKYNPKLSISQIGVFTFGKW